MSQTQPTLEATRNARARAAAQAAVERLTVTPTGVVHYHSRGHVVVIGGEEAQWLATRLTAPLRAEVVLLDGEDETGVPATPVAGRRLAITGHLGAFRIELGEPGHPNHQTIDAGLVVDLGEHPLFARDLPPPGYWHFGREAADLDAAKQALDGMLGTFEKPRYFAYDPDICAHARSGQAGCRQCIDSCPAEAIVSIGEHVEVDPNLCQGGGICSTVCPTGAMRYAFPPPQDTGARLRGLLKAYIDAGGTRPVALLVAEADVDALPSLPPNQLLVVIEELASVGHELWLAAIAWGAQRVVLVDGGSVPPRSRQALDTQVALCHAMLDGLGYDAGLLSTRDTQPSWPDIGTEPATGLPPPARFAATGDKRQLVRLATDHLWEHAPTPIETFPLPAVAPYGEIRVDAQRCTLCMSCTSVCPARALNAGDETPRLDFHEANCVQCGICANACPEAAITLQARYLADPARRRQSRVLHEDTPFCCVACGKPFATRRVIDNILGKLVGHAMFQSERARRRLQMCEDCRVVDALQDEDAMQAGLSLREPPRIKDGH